MKLSILATLLSSVSAFAPQSTGRVCTAVYDDLYGWEPDESKFAWGLPGSLPPAGQFDPLGFAKDTPLQTMLQWREAELQHGRVSMLAVLGMLIVEEPIEYHPLFEAYNKDIGPAIRQLDEVDATSPYFLIGELLSMRSIFYVTCHMKLCTISYNESAWHSL